MRRWRLNRNFQVDLSGQDRRGPSGRRRGNSSNTARPGTPSLLLNEGMGIWGQSFSGFVDRDGQFQVCFRRANAKRTSARSTWPTRPWAKPLRERGFVAQRSRRPQPDAVALCLATVPFEGRSCACTAARPESFGATRPRSAPTGTPPTRRFIRFRSRGIKGWSFRANAWRIVSVDASGKVAAAASGPLESGTTRERSRSTASKTGGCELGIDHKARWDGKLPLAAGQIGLLVDPFTNLERIAIRDRRSLQPGRDAVALSRSPDGGGRADERLGRGPVAAVSLRRRRGAKNARRPRRNGTSAAAAFASGRRKVRSLAVAKCSWTAAKRPSWIFTPTRSSRRKSSTPATMPATDTTPSCCARSKAGCRSIRLTW